MSQNMPLPPKPGTPEFKKYVGSDGYFSIDEIANYLKDKGIKDPNKAAEMQDQLILQGSVLVAPPRPPKSGATEEEWQSYYATLEEIAASNPGAFENYIAADGYFSVEEIQQYLKDQGVSNPVIRASDLQDYLLGERNPTVMLPPAPKSGATEDEWNEYIARLEKIVKAQPTESSELLAAIDNYKQIKGDANSTPEQVELARSDVMAKAAQVALAADPPPEYADQARKIVDRETRFAELFDEKGEIIVPPPYLDVDSDMNIEFSQEIATRMCNIYSKREKNDPNAPSAECTLWAGLKAALDQAMDKVKKGVFDVADCLVFGRETQEAHAVYYGFKKEQLSRDPYALQPTTADGKPNPEYDRNQRAFKDFEKKQTNATECIRLLTDLLKAFTQIHTELYACVGR